MPWSNDLDTSGMDPKSDHQNIPDENASLTSWRAIETPAEASGSGPLVPLARHEADVFGVSENASKDNSSTGVFGIGIVLNNGRYKCIRTACFRMSYNRPAELRRHYITKHALQRREFWCVEPSCERSVGIGNRPFHRKDKLRDHVRQMHCGRAELKGTARAVRREH
jgi:hypothetical protein